MLIPHGSMYSRPAELLAVLDRLMPNLWRKLDHARSRFVQWPKDIVVPSWAVEIPPAVKLDAGDPDDYTVSAVNRLAPDVYAGLLARGFLPQDRVLLLTAERAAMYAAWRATKMEFRFDEALATELLDTPVTGNIPAELLRRLPAQCIYVSYGQLRIGQAYQGFFAMLDQPSRGAEPVVRIFLDSGVRWPSMAYTIPVAGVCLEDFVRQRETASQAQLEAFLEMVGDEEAEAKAAVFRRRRDELAELNRKALGGILSLLLYLCSEEPDLPDEYAPSPVRQKVAGTQRRIVPPEAVRCWSVGVRLGAVFRKAKDATREPVGSASPTTVRPHVRRAHWHTYWVGSRGNQEPRLKWLSPILVGAKTAGDALPAVVRPVRPELPAT